MDTYQVFCELVGDGVFVRTIKRLLKYVEPLDFVDAYEMTREFGITNPVEFNRAWVCNAISLGVERLIADKFGEGILDEGYLHVDDTGLIWWIGEGDNKDEINEFLENL